MYKKKILVNIGFAKGSYRPCSPDVRVARPISYYINGGVDLDGLSNRPPLPGVSDSPEDISTGDINIATDARVGRLDILDLASQMATESASRAGKEITGDEVENDE